MIEANSFSYEECWWPFLGRQQKPKRPCPSRNSIFGRGTYVCKSFIGISISQRHPNNNVLSINYFKKVLEDEWISKSFQNRIGNDELKLYVTQWWLNCVYQTQNSIWLIWIKWKVELAVVTNSVCPNQIFFFTDVPFEIHGELGVYTEMAFSLEILFD